MRSVKGALQRFASTARACGLDIFCAVANDICKSEVFRSLKMPRAIDLPSIRDEDGVSKRASRRNVSFARFWHIFRTLASIRCSTRQAIRAWP